MNTPTKKIVTNSGYELPELQTEGNRFQILNGTWLEGYPLQTAGDAINGELQLDTTGEYLSLSESKPKQRRYKTPSEICRPFYSRASLFWQNRERIFADSRMFLAPVPACNGMAYTGAAGFNDPTLGIYLEWWERYEAAHFFDEKGEEWFMWFISGSPLSGANGCAAANTKGQSKGTSARPFLPVWRSFVEVNNRYKDIKPIYDAYSFEQVVELLGGIHP